MPTKTTKPKTAAQIVAECNELASLFYSQDGYQVRKGFRFDRATHPQEIGMWNMAAMAYSHITGVDPDDALSELEDDDHAE